jgi:reactive intermediate/imine deaminase
MMRVAIAVAMLRVSGSVVASSTDSQVSPHGNAKTMTKQIVHTDKAPAAIGPYSQAVKAGNTVYFSGQIPLDPATGAIVEGGIEAQARRAFDNLKAVAEAAGGSLDKVVRTGLFLTDLSDFAVVNAVMQEYFSAPYPARSTIQVAALPKGASFEVEATMVLD